AVYEAMAWTPVEAHRFLQAIPMLEAAGLVVRVPDWWRARRPPRPEVAVRVGEKKPSALGMDALLDFSVGVALGDERLPAAEVRELMASSSGLVRLRGQWVELDRERLREVLAHWERVRREAEQGGVSFLEGMRLLAGAGRTDGEASGLDAGEGWSRIEAGARLAGPRGALRGRAGRRSSWHAAALSEDRCVVAGVRLVAAARRVSGRRHGAWQDGPGAGTVVDAQAPRARRRAAPSHRGAGLPARQLAGRDRAVRAVAGDAGRASIDDVHARAPRAC